MIKIKKAISSKFVKWLSISAFFMTLAVIQAVVITQVKGTVPLVANDALRRSQRAPDPVYLAVMLEMNPSEKRRYSEYLAKDMKTFEKWNGTKPGKKFDIRFAKHTNGAPPEQYPIFSDADAVRIHLSRDRRSVLSSK